jgi:tRNA 2-thiouridine synthesizing protein A
MPTERPAGDPWVAAEWDAGQLGCGDLVLQLWQRMDALGPGQVLRLVALDLGAPADLPAWCRLTGHVLLAADHPVYFIRRKES